MRVADVAVSYEQTTRKVQPQIISMYEYVSFAAARYGASFASCMTSGAAPRNRAMYLRS